MLYLKPHRQKLHVWTTQGGLSLQKLQEGRLEVSKSVTNSYVGNNIQFWWSSETVQNRAFPTQAQKTGRATVATPPSLRSIHLTKRCSHDSHNAAHAHYNGLTDKTAHNHKVHRHCTSWHLPMAPVCLGSKLCSYLCNALVQRSVSIPRA